MTIFDPAARPAEIVDEALANKDKAALAEIKRLCLSQTREGLSFLARGVLGYDFFKDELTGKILRDGMEWEGEHQYGCGLVPWGPHGDMCEFLAEPPEPGKVKLLMTSRGGLKTTALQAKAVQDILIDPNIRIVILMATAKLAKDTSSVIRQQLTNPRLEALFGVQKSKHWGTDEFTVAIRSRIQREPTVMCAGIGVQIVGYHFDRALVDDLVSWQQSRSLDQMAKGIDCYTQLQPIMDPGAQQYITMTPYHEMDLSHHLRFNLGEFVQTLTIDCGMEAVKEPNGTEGLVGKPKFPHHSEHYLRSKLAHMRIYDFNTQYALKLLNPEDQVFFRDQFDTMAWEPWMAGCSAFILTDTAISPDDEACKSALALVLLDWDDTAYVADFRLGRFSMDEFMREYFDIAETWSSKVRIRGVAMEQIALNRAYRNTMENLGRKRGFLPHFIHPTYGRSGDDKARRIFALTSRFSLRKIKFLDTVPRNYVDRGKSKLLYDPLGFIDDKGAQPGGEIVEQFVTFRRGDKAQHNKDAADALALLEMRDSQGKRFLPLPPRPGLARPHWKAAASPEERRRLAKISRGDWNPFGKRMRSG